MTNIVEPESELSLAALGALAWINSRDDGVEISQSDIARRFHVGKDKAKKVFNELLSLGCVDVAVRDKSHISPRWRDISPRKWMILKAEIFARDNYVCTYCGSDNDKLECDHILPISRGGTSHPSNLATSCIVCNRSKGSKTLVEWKQ